ncbi:ion channel [Pontibacter oryzae]|nr:ion channel [Pontibacter oryzae]
MSILYFSIGSLIFLFIIADIIKTTFSLNGGGKLTNLVSRGVWNTFFVASAKKGNSKLLEYAGPAVLVSILVVWVIGLWSGLFLMLLSDPSSVVNSITKENTGAWEKLYYAGFTLSTLGVGDYIASNNFWRVITDIAAYSGLVFITTSITYFVPVLSAVGLQSKLSLYISGMGKSPQQVLEKAWNGKDFSSFFDTVSDLCQMLMHHTMNHHSYPVIHYFHNNQLNLAIAPAFVKLDEVHQLLSNALKDDVTLDNLKMNMLQTALDQHLEMLRKGYLKEGSPKEQVPALTEQVSKLGVAFRKPEEINHRSDQALAERRKLLTVMLEKDGWTWDAVHQSNGYSRHQQF